MGTRLDLFGLKGLVSFTDGIKTGQMVLNAKTINLTSAQVLALNASPAELLPAPGANKYYQVVGVNITYDYATAYTIGSATNLTVRYTDGSGAAITTTLAATGFLDQTSDQHRIVANVTTNVTPVTNAAIVLNLAGADVTGGTSTLMVNLVYRIIDLA